MPSLRRALSSPSVRSSPYPSTAGPLGPHRRRRSTGTGKETASRRVLADLDWWSVVDGQRDVDLEQVTDEHEHDYFSFTFNAIARPSTPTIMGHSENTIFSASPQTPTTPVPFPVLPFAPHTPTRGEQSSTRSSVESTPEAVIVSRPCIAFADLDLDAKFFAALPSLSQRKRTPSNASKRSFTCNNIIPSQTCVAERFPSFADIPASPVSHLKLLD